MDTQCGLRPSIRVGAKARRSNQLVDVELACGSFAGVAPEAVLLQKLLCFGLIIRRSAGLRDSDGRGEQEQSGLDTRERHDNYFVYVSTTTDVVEARFDASEVLSSPLMGRQIARSAVVFLLAVTSVVAADITGIWAGQQPGRRGEPEDVAFRFKVDGPSITGKMFGDEFDLPISEASITGDQIRFVIITTNYYSGSKSRFIYTGTIKGSEMELVRERVQTPEEKAANRPLFKQTVTLKQIS